MSGRRLLDAAAIFKASRGVAAKHVALRKHQLDAYSKTSSVAKAVKSQTDRATLTVKAATALAGHFNETGPTYSTQTSSPDKPARDASIPSQNSVKGAYGTGEGKQEVAPDHFYERSGHNATTEPPRDGELDVKQEKANRRPLPDGSIPPAGVTFDIPKRDKESYSELPQAEPVKNPLKNQKGQADEDLQATSSGRTSIPDPAKSSRSPSAVQAKKLQWKAEKQIPSQAAEPPPKAAPQPKPKESGLKAAQEQDVFYTPPPASGRVLSALPRAKVPKNTQDTQESDEHVPDTEMNQDVFYSSTPNHQEEAGTQAQAVPQQEQLSEAAYSEIFHSPKVAKMLKGQPMKEARSRGLHLPEAKDASVKATKSPQEGDQVSSNTRTPTEESIQASKTEKDRDVDVHELATDMAKDAESSSTNAAQVGTPYSTILTAMLID